MAIYIYIYIYITIAACGHTWLPRISHHAGALSNQLRQTRTWCALRSLRWLCWPVGHANEEISSLSLNSHIVLILITIGKHALGQKKRNRKLNRNTQDVKFLEQMRAQVLQIRAQLCGWVWWRLYKSIYPTNPPIRSDGNRCAACLCFLPGGLVFGYTMCAFIAERNLDLIDYGPLILGACLALVSALSFLLIKYLKKCIIYWQPLLLLVAGAFNLIASCFYFADGFGE